MQAYAYRAVNSSGEIVSAELSCANAKEARQQVARQGLTLIELKERRVRSARRAGDGEHSQALIEFTRSMGSLLTAGIPLLQILEDLEVQADKKPWRKRLHDMRMRIEGGSSVSEAMAMQRGAFSEIYVNLVQAGEESGRLPDVFRRLTDYLEWRRSLAQQVKQALSYPATVMGAMVLLVCLLTFFVFPRLSEVFNALEIVLPLPTRVLLAVGQFGGRSWPYMVVAVPVLAVAVSRAPRWAVVRRFIDRVVLRLPIIGRVAAMVTYSRFASSLATLLSSGVQLDRALDLTENAVGNTVVAKKVRGIRDRVQGGETLGGALANTGGFPLLVIRMVRVGESSGDLVGMLQNCNDYFEREIPQVIRKALGAVGPIMVVLLGLMVIWVALSIFLPLMQVGTAVK